MSFLKSMDVNLAILDVELDVFLLVLDVNSSAIVVISPNIHPIKSFCQYYIHCKSASCKNAMYPQVRTHAHLPKIYTTLPYCKLLSCH